MPSYDVWTHHSETIHQRTASVAEDEDDRSDDDRMDEMLDDVLPSNHKMPKDIYQSKKILSALGMEYEKIDVCKDNCMIFYKQHKNEMKCLKCGKPRFIEVVNEDGEKVMTKTAHKQLCYMPLTPRMKWLFISKKTARHMRWHKEGVRENDQVMVHPSDSEAWKALDDFDPNFV
jgi:hypothetical protein